MYEVKKLIILSLRGLHLIALLFLLFGSLIPGSLSSCIHVFFVPLVVIHWQTNQGTCCLTNLENKLLGTAKPIERQRGQFIKSLLRLCCKELPEDRVIRNGLYAILGSSWSISLIRVLL